MRCFRLYREGLIFLEISRANAAYFIPSENEWYKAAYYDPTTEGHDIGFRVATVPEPGSIALPAAGA
jgi:hypothetical protein